MGTHDEIVAKAKAKIEHHIKETEKIKKKNVDLDKSIVKIKKEKDQIKKDRDLIRKKNDSLDNNIDKLKKENEELRARLAAKRARAKTTGGAKRRKRK